MIGPLLSRPARGLLRLALLSRWLLLPVAGYWCLAFCPWLVIAVVAALLVGLWQANRLPKVRFGDLMGSARLASLDDVVAAGAVGPGGIPLGVTTRPPTFREACRVLRSAPRGAAVEACRVFWAWAGRRPVPVALKDAVGVALFAPAGAGKSTAFTITQLLENPRESAFVLDPAGEQYKATAAARRRAGQRVVLLDPFGVTGDATDALNPIGSLSWHDTYLVDKARQMAGAVVVRTGSEHEPFWDDAAENLLTAGVVFQVGVADSLGDPSVQTLGEVFALVADRKRFDAAMTGMTRSTAHDGTVAALAHQVLNHTGDEAASVMSAAMRHAGWVNTPVTKAITGRSTFDPADLRARRTTVYLVVPPTALQEKRGWVRSVLTCCLRACVDAGADRHARVRFVLDEAASLGRLDAIEQALTQMRKYGVRLYLAYQSVKQLERCFPEGGSDVLLGNVTQVYCGLQDYATAELASKQVGRATEASYTFSGGTSTSASYGQDGQGSTQHGSNDNWSATAYQRELIQPEEILQLGPGLALTFTPGLPPLLTRPLRFFDPEYRRATARPPGGLRLLARSACAFALGWGLLLGAASVAVPAASAEFDRQRDRPPAGPPEVVRDAFGRPVLDARGFVIPVPPGVWVEHDRQGRAWLTPVGQRRFR